MATFLLDNAVLATQTTTSTSPTKDGCVLVSGGRIRYAGERAGLPDPGDATVINVDGRLITPGLIDCHTHLVYAGSRADEFQRRKSGESYAEISASGGGIAATVAATRAATESALVEASLTRLDRLIAEGVTTVEVKSGYGLDRDTELKMLRVARKLGELRPVRIVTTFLGAHAVPTGIDADHYIDDICIPTLQDAAAAGLVDMVDGFCEHIAFSPAQVARVFMAAKALKLPVRLHAEQLSPLGGAALAAKHGATCADHLEYLDPVGVAAMASAGTVAVLLPGAFYTLNEKQVPPIAALRDAGVPIALATDSNPGSSPMTSLLLAMNMGATLFDLTPRECLSAVTRHASAALGLTNIGALTAGFQADLAIWDVSNPAELTYRIGDAPLHRRIYAGQL